MQMVANKFEQDYGIPVRIETPEKITDNFPLAAQAGKGPDIVIWAHDKTGEWADGGVIAPIEVTAAYKQPTWELRANVQNVFNVMYYDSLMASDGGRAVAGNGLTGLLTLTYRM